MGIVESHRRLLGTRSSFLQTFLFLLVCLPLVSFVSCYQSKGGTNAYGFPHRARTQRRVMRRVDRRARRKGAINSPVCAKVWKDFHERRLLENLLYWLYKPSVPVQIEYEGKIRIRSIYTRFPPWLLRPSPSTTLLFSLSPTDKMYLSR